MVASLLISKGDLKFLLLDTFTKFAAASVEIISVESLREATFCLTLKKKKLVSERPNNAAVNSFMYLLQKMEVLVQIFCPQMYQRTLRWGEIMYEIHPEMHELDSPLLNETNLTT